MNGIADQIEQLLAARSPFWAAAEREAAAGMLADAAADLASNRPITDRYFEELLARLEGLPPDPMRCN